MNASDMIADRLIDWGFKVVQIGETDSRKVPFENLVNDVMIFGFV